MKNNFKITSSLLAALVCMLIFASCVKSRADRTDLESVSPIVQIPEGGIANFASDAINFPPDDPTDTVFFHVNYAAKTPAPKDITVTLAVDPAALAAYNANPANQVKYEAFPSSYYSFASTSVTIKAGQNYTEAIPVIIHPDKVDPTRNFMLPITIKDASGNPISGNFGTIYYHLIGNPLAGAYTVTGKRYNYSGSIGYSGGPIPTNYVSTSAIPNPKVAAAVDPNTIVMDYSNLGGNGYQYIITYDPANPTNVEVSGNFLSAVSNFAVIIHTYDPATKTMHIRTTYNNGAGGSGNDRIVDETFVHQ